MKAYGEKRDYPAIRIFWRGQYKATTTWAKTCREAKARFLEKHNNLTAADVRAFFSKD